jgi:glutathione peroxidase
MSDSLYDIPVNRIDGAAASLGDYKGKVILVVNVASKCGLTPQYAGLEKLYEDFKDKGLVVTGFPANEFGAQEPGTNDEIADFCTTNFGVKFPMFEKIVVKGEGQHPLYASLTKAIPAAEGVGDRAAPDGSILWNFEKFLVAKDGHVARRFSPRLAPEDPILIGAIEEELAK